MDFNLNVCFSGAARLDVVIHADALVGAIRDVLAAVTLNTRSNTIMSAEFDALSAQVHANTDATAAATALIQGISARITAAGTDPAALKALTDELNASDTALAAAVTANTPAAPAP